MSAQYQTYTSARQSTRMVTPTGKPISFANFNFYTQDEDVIAYLDAEIKQGLQGVTKGELVESNDVNPMEVFRKKVIAEFLAEQKLAKTENKDFGSTPMSAKALNAGTSKNVAS